MTALTKPKLVIYLAAIFFAGGISGAFIGYHLRTDRRPPFRGPPSSEEMVRFVREKLYTEVGINDDQWTMIAPIITNSVHEIGELDTRNRQRVSELIDRCDARIMEKLTPEQQPRMQKMIEERQKHHHGSPHEHGPGGKPGPGKVE